MGRLLKKISIFRRRKKEKNLLIIDEVPVRAKVSSLGSGTLSIDGTCLVEFIAKQKSCGESESTLGTLTSTTPPEEGLESNESCLSSFRHNIDYISEKLHEKVHSLPERIQSLKPTSFTRLSSTFLRVADLEMTNPIKEEKDLPNFHHSSDEPPPGIEHDPKEEWVALDDGTGSAAPIAPYAVAALASFGHKTAMDQSMWRCEGKTDKILKTSAWKDISWHESGPVTLPEKFNESEEIPVWSGNFMHGLYGSDLPAVRCMGIVNMPPKDLVNLLTDSDRVKEYNNMSLGRTDLLVLQDNLYEEGAPEGIFGKSVTKVMRAETQPPIIRRNLQFVSILHVTELEDGGGYLLVSRAVTQASEVGTYDSYRSEILMGVNVIRRIEGDDSRCVMINVNHVRTPMVPLFLGKKIALSCAPNFIRDLNAIC